MKIKRQKRLNYGESCAASDVAFQLIIYFLVIAGFNINQGFIMNLPAKDSVRMIQTGDLLRYDMDNRGVIFYEGQTVDRRTVEGEIYATIQEHPHLAVLLTIDPAAPWQQVIYFVELAQRLDVESFSFRMRTD